MSKELISRGKNLKEAIGIGLDLMEVTKSQVDIEIIQNEAMGFLGIFGKKPAIVRITKKALDKAPDSSFNLGIPTSETSLHANHVTTEPDNEVNEPEATVGKVWVKDGQIFCKESPTRYPSITPVKGISLYKNGELVRKTTVLTEADQLKVEFPNEQKDLTWSIHLDSTKMSAVLQVEPGYRKEYRLIDQTPSSHIQLKTQIQEEIIHNLQQDEIERRMKELGINTGIQIGGIQKAIQSTEPGTFTIAQGIDPEQGENGWLECIIETELRQNGPKLLENGDFDFRELITFPNVEIGQVIGIIHPPKPGKAGFTVKGKEVQPKPAKEMVVLVQRGVEWIDQGTKIIAVESGRPYVEYRGNLKAKVSVIPRLLHSADVDIASGNLRYFGDIEIRGNVKEGMTVEAMKDVLVYGTIEFSTITAGNHITICKNVFNSRLFAGVSNQLVKEINDLMGTVSSELKKLGSAVEQVYQSPVFKTSDIVKVGLSSIIRILLDSKFKTLPPLIKELCGLIEKADKLQIADDEYTEVRIHLINGFINLLPRQFNQPEDLMTLIDRMEELCALDTVSKEEDTHIMLPYALHCEIVCSGNISITGKGSFHSNIHAGGKVQINGMLRGGEVYAELGVEAEQAGTVGGTVTHIRVPEGQSIKINEALEGTIIQIGNHSYQFASSVQNVLARVNKEGNLLLF